MKKIIITNQCLVREIQAPKIIYSPIIFTLLISLGFILLGGLSVMAGDKEDAALYVSPWIEKKQALDLAVSSVREYFLEYFRFPDFLPAVQSAVLRDGIWYVHGRVSHIPKPRTNGMYFDVEIDADLGVLRVTSEGLSFASLGVLHPVGFKRRDVALPVAQIIKLSVEAGKVILSAPVGEETWAGFSWQVCERCLINHESQDVSRSGNRLIIKTKSASPVIFVDMNMGGSPGIDGDSMRHIYFGKVGKFGYHRVGWSFNYGDRASFLINPINGKTAFVGNGEGVVYFSPDEVRLIQVPPFSPSSFGVIVLDDHGPTSELKCNSMMDKYNVDDIVAETIFKGWRDSNTFDLVLKNGQVFTPVRIEWKDKKWTVATPNPAFLKKQYGFVCWQ